VVPSWAPPSGGEAAAEQDNDGTDDERIWKESQGSEVSSLSSLGGSRRPTSRRGENQRRRKTQANLRRLQERVEAAGGVWAPTASWDDMRAQKTQAVASATACAGKENMLQLALRPCDGSPADIPEEIRRLIAETERRYIIKQQGYERCLICDCWSDESHRKGKNHEWATLVHAVDTWFCGWPLAVRPRAVGAKPLPKPRMNDEEDKFELSYDDVQRHWGDQLADFGNAAGRMIKARGVVAIKSSGSACVQLPSSAIEGVTPALVNYRAHSGKYTATAEVLMLPDLPREVGGATEWWPVVLLGVSPETRKHFGIEVDVGRFATDDGEEAVYTGDLRFWTESPHASLAVCLRQLAHAHYGESIVAWPLRLRSRL
jgi:hypothetical protein